MWFCCRSCFQYMVLHQISSRFRLFSLVAVYLSGAKAVTQELEQKWKDDELIGFNLENILSDDASWKEENKDQASFKTYIGLAAAGFINGVNPCGASMLLMLLAAILVNLPVYLKGKGAQKFFKFAPPIVLLYLGMMLLCTMKMWNLEDTAATYKAVKNPLLYAMLFLMLLRCDLKKIIKLGPKMLIGFFAASLSICTGFIVSYVYFP